MRAARQHSTAQHILPWCRGSPARGESPPSYCSSWAQKSWVVTPELLPKGQQRSLRSPELLEKEGEGALAFSALLFLPVFIKYKIHSLCSQQSKSTLSSSKVRPSNPPLPEAWWKHHKTVSELRRGQLSHLCTLQPPEALLSAGALWSSLTSCSVLPCAAGPILGGKPSLVTDLGTSSATYAQMGHTARDSSTASGAPEGLQQHKQSWVTGISFFCRASWDWGRHY